MNINYDLIERGKRGRLLSPLVFKDTPIIGYKFNDPFNLHASLGPSGELVLHTDFEWDFGSYAIDTPAMVIASAFHDLICRLTNMRILPWEYRARADSHFRELLKQNGTPFLRRWWCWMGVRTYSECMAVWKDKV